MKRYVDITLAGILAVVLLVISNAAHPQVPIYTKGPSSSTSSVPSTAFPLLAPDGLVGSPSYAFSTTPTLGVYNAGSAVFAIAAGGQPSGGFRSTGMVLPRDMTFAWLASTTDFSGAVNTTLGSDAAANVLALKNANSAQEFRVYAGNGGFLSNVKTVTESLTIAAAATTASATSIPAGAILIAVAVRVTTVIPTAATFTVTTTTGGTTLNTAAVSTAATSTDPGTAAGTSYRAAATTVTITPNLTPGTATGVVRLQFYYLQVTPPTS